MYQTHEFLRIFSVLLAVAQKYICVKCRSHLLRKFIADKHGREIFFKLLLIADGGVIPVILIKILNISALFIKQIIKSVFLHKRQNRYVMLFGKRKLKVNRSVLPRQQLCCDRHDEELHLTEIRE